MNWRVTYRDNDAKQKVDIFQAENRRQLFAKLSELKISPIKIEQVEEVKIARKWEMLSLALLRSIISVTMHAETEQIRANSARCCFSITIKTAETRLIMSSFISSITIRKVL